MNAFTPIPILDAEAWTAAHKAVNAWRGRAIHYYSQAEAEVSETLLALSAVAGRGAKVRLQRLVGQRFNDLAAAIGPDGEFAAEGKKAFAALTEFREQEALRAVLCHGAAKVTLDQRGEWMVTLRLLVFRGRAPERSVTIFERDEADSELSILKAREQRLRSALEGLRKALGAE